MQSTEFAAAATCTSVGIVDYEPPEDSGLGAAGTKQSFVQVCAISADGLTLAEFMERTYGAARGGFSESSLSGYPAYRLDSGPGTSTIFVQVGSTRFQVVTAVVAAPELQAQRVSEVAMVLESLAFG